MLIPLSSARPSRSCHRAANQYKCIVRLRCNFPSNVGCLQWISCSCAPKWFLLLLFISFFLFKHHSNTALVQTPCDFRGLFEHLWFFFLTMSGTCMKSTIQESCYPASWKPINPGLNSFGFVNSKHLQFTTQNSELQKIEAAFLPCFTIRLQSGLVICKVMQHGQMVHRQVS